MEWKNWSFVPLSDRCQLPSDPGIYIVADANDFVWYVGQAQNLQDRWIGKGHHRYPQLIRSNRKLSHRIYWKRFPTDQLDHQEKFFIELLKPELNGCKVKEYLPKEPQVIREIKRVLKVINKPSLLFPIIRSVLIGYYTNEEGLICFVIVIQPNDFR